MTDYDNPTAEALDLWQEIVGVKAGSSSYTLGAAHHRGEFERLREALDLDPTEITANLLLGYYARKHFQDTHVTQAELLADTDGILKLLEKPRRLLEILERPEIVERRAAFIAGVTQALEMYGAADREDIQKVLDDHDAMAFLRRDALRSMEKLSVHQFLDGDPEPDSVRPVYYKFVHQWFNVNSMLDAVAKQAPGVSLNLIRDPNDYQSYFCFAIRNGGRVFVLSDVPKNAHPLQPMLSRRPEREMDRRVAQNWFPYDLMGMAYNEESGQLYFDRSSERSLVVGQSEALPLKPISKIGPHETIWTAMMFGLIVDRFWRKGHTEKQLSYTAEMVRVEDKMLTSAAKSGLPVKGYAKIDAKPLERTDIMHPTAEAEEAFGPRTKHENAWMEERYGHLVTEESLNLIASPERHHRLALMTGEITDSRNRDDLSDRRFYMDSRVLSTVKVEKLPSTTFGSKEKIEADRLFIARYNYAIQINALARNEYEKRKDEITKWYRAKVDANAETLKSWVGDQILWVPSTHDRYSSKMGHGYSPTGKQAIRSFAFPWVMDDVNKRVRNLGLGTKTIGGFESTRGYLCAINETKASYCFTFCPANAKEIAVVAGCEESELPDVLQHYDLGTDHKGNQLLDRVDPLDWAVHNPWDEFDARVGIFLSKRGFDKLCKSSVKPPYWEEHGLKEVTQHDWRTW